MGTLGPMLRIRYSLKMSFIKALYSLNIKYHYNMPYTVKAKSQWFTRKKIFLFRKVYELKILCGDVDVMIIIYTNGKYYIYQSNDHNSWPLTIISIINTF